MTQQTSNSHSVHHPPFPPNARILVTGAAGGLGQHLTQRLRELGYRVRALDRLPQPATDPRFRTDSPDVSHLLEWIHLDFAPGDDLDPVVKGCVAVIHAAANVSLSESFADLRADNVAFVEALYAAATRAKVEHFVHMSCASVYRADRGVHTEESEVKGFNGYEKTKIASEAILTKHAGEPDSLPYTILRPAMLYGPGCTSMAANMVTLPAILKGMVSYLPGLSGGPKTSWCHIEDACDAVITVLGYPEAFGRCFNVADNSALSFGEVLTAIAHAYGLEVGPSVPFPNATILSLVTPLINNESSFDLGRKLLRQAWRRLQARHNLHSPLRPRLDRSALFYVGDDSIVLANELKTLGWEPRWPSFQLGIVDTIRWYQEQGWAPRFDHLSQVEVLDANRPPGITYAEELHGSANVIAPFNHHAEPNSVSERAPNAPRKAALNLALEWPAMPRFLAVTEGHINGTITIEGVVENAPVQGIATIRLLPPFEMTYEFGFLDQNQQPHRFCGNRKVGGLLPLRSPSSLDGHVINHRGECIGTLVVHSETPNKVLPRIAALLKS